MTLLVISNAPNRDSATKIATKLVEEKLAACVNILAECTSTYRWQGEIEHATEIPILIKTCADVYSLVERAIKELHPYELPEIIAVPITEGLPAYLNWVIDQSFPTEK